MEIRLAPNRYVRESGVIQKAGSYLNHLGKKTMLVGGKTALSIAGDVIKASLEREGVEVLGPTWYGGECSWENIDHLADLLHAAQVDYVIGIGGGKAIDTVKGAAFKLNLTVATVPTIAATCAAWTPLSIIYSQEGHYLDSSRKSQQPSWILADSDIIGQAPCRYLVSGMGDTLAKWYETDVAVKKAGYNAATMSAHSLSLLCKKMIQDYGPDAMASCTAKNPSDSLDQIIDAIIAVSGMVSDLGGDSCASAAAHPIAAGLTLIDEVHQRYHGEVVAFGVLGQLMLEGKEYEVVDDYLSIATKLDLPMTLSQLGLPQISADMLKKVSEKAVQARNMCNIPFPVTANMVAEAIMKADGAGKAYIQGKQG